MVLLTSARTYAGSATHPKSVPSSHLAPQLSPSGLSCLPVTRKPHCLLSPSPPDAATGQLLCCLKGKPAVSRGHGAQGGRALSQAQVATISQQRKPQKGPPFLLASARGVSPRCHLLQQQGLNEPQGAQQAEGLIPHCSSRQLPDILLPFCSAMGAILSPVQPRSWHCQQAQQREASSSLGLLVRLSLLPRADCSSPHPSIQFSYSSYK